VYEMAVALPELITPVSFVMISMLELSGGATVECDCVTRKRVAILFLIHAVDERYWLPRQCLAMQRAQRQL
jgi:hypothetical protein